MFQVPRLHGILQARSLVQPTPSTQGSTLAPSYKTTLAPLPFWDCLVKTMLAFLLLGFFPLVTSKIFFTTRPDLRLVPRALAGALASGVPELLALGAFAGFGVATWVPRALGRTRVWEGAAIQGHVALPRVMARMAPLTSLFLGVQLRPVRAPAFSVGASAHAQHLLQWFVLLAGEPRLLDYLQLGQWW